MLNRRIERIARREEIDVVGFADLSGTRRNSLPSG